MKVFGDFAVDKLGNVDTYFIVDADMADRLGPHKWTMDGSGYPCRNEKGKHIRLHTWIVEQAYGKTVPTGMYVDHINRCKTDNRLCNLRIVSPQDSSRNMPIKADNVSGVTGVCVGRGGKGYRAYITVNKKRIELGTYKTKGEAARARYAAEERYGFKHQQNLEAFLIEMEGN